MPSGRSKTNSRKQATRKSPHSISFIVGMLESSAHLDNLGQERRGQEADTMENNGSDNVLLNGKVYQAVVLPPNSCSLGITLAAQILAGQAAELALKYVFEQENPSKTAPQIHRLDILYSKLSEWSKKMVEADYLNRKRLHDALLWPGYETAEEVFRTSRDYPVWARYATEGGQQSVQLQPIFLREAVCSVLASGGYNVHWGTGA